MTRAMLLDAIATQTGRKRRIEREADAKVADAVLDVVLPIVWEFVEDQWEGDKLLSKLRGLRGES